MEKARLKAWQHPENLIPVEEIEVESFGDRNRQNPFGFGTAVDEFLAAETVFDDGGFDDGAFGFGRIFEQPPFSSPPEATGTRNRSIVAGVAWPGSGHIPGTASPTAFVSRTQIGMSRMGNTRTGTAHLGNAADSRSALTRDMANFLAISRPAAASTLSRIAGDPGVGPSTTSDRRQNEAASSSRVQTRAATVGSDRQPNDVATSRSRAPATTVASSSRSPVSVEASAATSRVAAGATAAANNAQRSASTTTTTTTTSARLRATTGQTSSGVRSGRTAAGVAIGLLPRTWYIGPGMSTTRTSRRTSGGNSTGRNNAQRRASMTTSSMFENDIFPTRIFGRGSYPVSPYGGYGHESVFDMYEDPYYDDYDDPYEDGYYGGRRYY